MICGLEERPWTRIRDEIQRQITEAGVNFELLTEIDARQRTSGEKRQSLLCRAKGDYVAFVDDDDRISEDYIRKIAAALEKNNPDVLTFNLLMATTGGRNEIWSFMASEDNRKTGVMSANHLCFWKKDLARKIAWCPVLGYGDDQLWYKPLIKSGLIQDELRIPGNPIYYYDYSPVTTVNQQSDRTKYAKRYAARGLQCFLRDDGILVEHHRHPDPRFVQVRDCDNNILAIRPTDYRQICRIRIT